MSTWRRTTSDVPKLDGEHFCNLPPEGNPLDDSIERSAKGQVRLIGPKVSEGESEAQRISLRGISRLYVGAEPLCGAALEIGVSEDDLISRVRAGLSELNIDIVAISAAEPDEPLEQDLPVLMAVLTVGRVIAREPGLYVIAMDLVLHQWVRLVREPTITTIARTWYAGVAGAAVGETLLNVVDTLLDGRI